MKRFIIKISMIFCAGMISAPALFAQNDALYVDPSGRVGIGTPRPAYQLTITTGGNTNAFGVDNRAIFSAKNSSQQYENYLWPRWDDNKMYLNYGRAGFVIRNNDNGHTMVMTPEGNVGIGTVNNPGAKLEVNGSIKLDLGKKIWWDWDGRAIDVVSAEQNSRVMRFTNSMTAGGGNARGGFNFTDEGGNSALRIVDHKVGIGTTTPYAKLDVIGNIYTGIRATNDFNRIHDAEYRGTTRIGMLSGDFTGMELETEKWECGNGGVIKFITWGCNTDYPREVVRINERGYMGIGTNRPNYPLEVNGFANHDLGGEFYFMFRDACRRAGGGGHVNSISIKASNGIQSGSGLYVTSDRRLKKNLVASDNKTDLQKINKLTVTDYQFKDVVTQGSKLNKGFIAQDVEKVFPQAVSKESDFVPGIYALADKAVAQNGVLKVTLKNPHKLASGDVVRLITERSEVKEVAVTVLNETTFTVSNWDAPVANLFVYGKKVDDFRVVEYQQIFAMGVSAIQQLSKEVDALKAENEQLKKQTALSQDQLSKNTAALTNVMARLEALEVNNTVVKK